MPREKAYGGIQHNVTRDGEEKKRRRTRFGRRERERERERGRESLTLP